MARLIWSGPEVLLTVIAAAKEAVDEAMAAMATEAQSNHPGWKSVTGRAEQSIRIVEPAKVSRASVRGRWGSTGVPYMNMLEFLHGRALISAHDKVKASLVTRLRTKYRFAAESKRGRRRREARRLRGRR